MFRNIDVSLIDYNPIKNFIIDYYLIEMEFFLSFSKTKNSFTKNKVQSIFNALKLDAGSIWFLILLKEQFALSLSPNCLVVRFLK